MQKNSAKNIKKFIEKRMPYEKETRQKMKANPVANEERLWVQREKKQK